jgi:hypothetical protein
MHVHSSTHRSSRANTCAADVGFRPTYSRNRHLQHCTKRLFRAVADKGNGTHMNQIVQAAKSFIERPFRHTSTSNEKTPKITILVKSVT